MPIGTEKWPRREMNLLLAGMFQSSSSA